MTKAYYHATPSENLESILSGGIIKGFEGCVYLTDNPNDCIKFLMLRFHKKINVIEVFLEEDLVEESFDHNEGFFKCKAYAYYDNIPITEFGNIYECNLVIPGHSEH